jgi:hypothetical protein
MKGIDVYPPTENFHEKTDTTVETRTQIIGWSNLVSLALNSDSTNHILLYGSLCICKGQTECIEAPTQGGVWGGII